MLFNFKLDPIDEIAPWGKPPDLHLSWYALTLGQCFLQAGSEELLRYSGPVLEKELQESQESQVQPYVRYQVARFRENIFDIVPRVLEPLPPEIAIYARSTRAQAWLSKCTNWFARQSRNDAVSNCYDAAAFWLRERSLDTYGLQVPANVWFWRFGDTIHIEWDNREQRYGSVPVWAAAQGTHSIHVEEFMAELGSLHARLIAAMQLRIDEACRSWSRPEIHIDLDRLRENQSFWDDRMERFILRWEPTDWKAAVAAIQQIESSANS